MHDTIFEGGIKDLAGVEVDNYAVKCLVSEALEPS